jgi:hypothetical protein
MEDWRPHNPEEAVLSACSTLINVIDDQGSNVVQFSHFSVKEFLTSDRIRTSEVENIHRFYTPLSAAHTILAKGCLAVLLRLDDDSDPKAFPLASYAAQHWVGHARYEGVESQVQDAMEQLFNPKKPYLAAWLRIYDVQFPDVFPSISTMFSFRATTALYYAALCGFSRVAKYLITSHAEDVNTKSGLYGTPFDAAMHVGHLDVIRVLLGYGANMTSEIPLMMAYRRGDLDVMRLYLEHGANGDAWYGPLGLISHDASYRGQVEVMQLLLQHKVDANAKGSSDHTPLHLASVKGHANIAELLLKYGADANAQDMDRRTPLHQASRNGHSEVVRMLLEYAAGVHLRDAFGQTPFQMATYSGHNEIAQLLSKYNTEEE